MCIDILLIVLAFCISILTTLAIFYFRMSKKNKEVLARLTEYSINTQSIVDETIPAILSKIIDECFEDYSVMFLLPKGETYINDEREKEIRNDLVNKVVERLSPMAIDKLSLYYNRDSIDKIIADKIYILVVNYVASVNAVPAPDDIPNDGIFMG